MSVNPPPHRTVGGLSVYVLSTIAFLCIAMIGATGYLKYRLDRAELALAAPESSFTPEQEIYEKSLHALGYGGFLDSAQNFITQRDKMSLEEMKRALKDAQDALNRLPDKTPASVRHDIQTIMAVFTATAKRAEQFQDSPTGFTNADLLSAQAALPVLDARLQTALATNRMKAQDAFKMWGLGLMLVAWLSLILAAALAAATHAALRNRLSVPLHALAQSVENLARGDMQIPVWGMERKDAIGELARAIDLARYHFSRLPDLSLMSDQGPVRLRFEGETRSLFEAMMRNIGDEYERARSETNSYTGTIASQKEILTSVAARLNALLAQVEQQSSGNDAALQRLVRTLTDSAEVLTQTQESGSVQISKLVPFMQERAQNMAEVTRIAGTQMTQMLQALVDVEKNLRENAAQGQDVIQKLSTDANEMSERLFATVNLVQASSKVLTETTETTQSRFNEAVNTLNKGEGNLRDIIGRAESRLNGTAKAEETIARLAARTENSSIRMDAAIAVMAERHEKLSEQVVMATHRMDAIVASFDSARRSMGDTMQLIHRDGSALNTLLQELKNNNEQLFARVGENTQAGAAAVQGLTERSTALMQRLEQQIEQLTATSGDRMNTLTTHSQVLAQQVQATTSSLSQAVNAMRMEHDKLTLTRTHFADTVDQLGSQILQQSAASFNKTEALAAQSYDKLAALAEHMDSVLQRLNILGQLTGTLGAVAGQLGQLVPALSQEQGQTSAVAGVAPESIVGEFQRQEFRMASQIKSLHDQLTHTVQSQVAEPLSYIVSLLNKGAGSAGSAAPVALPDNLLGELQTQWDRALSEIRTMHEQLAHLVAQQMAGSLGRLTQLAAQGEGGAVSVAPDAVLKEVQDQWHQAMVHIEAMHDQLAQMIVAQKDQLETRLIVMDKKMASSASEAAINPMQAALMNEIVATLANINDHVMQLDDVMMEAGLKKA